jgi:hypothetical protein
MSSFEFEGTASSVVEMAHGAGGSALPQTAKTASELIASCRLCSFIISAMTLFGALLLPSTKKNPPTL